MPPTKKARRSAPYSKKGRDIEEEEDDEDEDEDEDDEEDEDEEDEGEAGGKSVQIEPATPKRGRPLKAKPAVAAVPPPTPKRGRPTKPKGVVVPMVTDKKVVPSKPTDSASTTRSLVAVPVEDATNELLKAKAELKVKAQDPANPGLAVQPPYNTSQLEAMAAHHKNALERHVEGRANVGVSGAIYTGCSHGSSVQHFWYLIEPTAQVIAATQNDGRLYNCGEFYAINVANNTVVSFARARPVHFEVPDLPPAVFDKSRQAQIRHLAGVGIVSSCENPRQVNLKTGTVETIREINVMFPQNGVLIPVPVSLWGARATGVEIQVGEVIWLLNCKTDNFLGFVRLSLGDTGSVLTKLKTDQAKELLKLAKIEAKLEMPSGMKPL